MIAVAPRAAALALAIAVAPGRSNPPAAPGLPLRWDSTQKTYQAAPGDSIAVIAFRATNPSAQTITVDQVEPSCGCTSAELPAHPWRIPPGGSGTLKLKVDLIGKSGELRKSATVYSSAGEQRLAIRVITAPMTQAMRAANREAAEHDRQAVFRGDCARCHAAPALGKRGGGLFVAACAICHFSDHRASMVPDIVEAKEPRDAAYWRGVIANGRPGTLMPGFSSASGGPLTDDQISSLVDFLLRSFPRTPRGISRISDGFR